jgi:hypothetical protein
MSAKNKSNADNARKRGYKLRRQTTLRSKKSWSAYKSITMSEMNKLFT